MGRLSVVFATVLICGGAVRAGPSGIEVLSESYHVWGEIGLSGFYDSYDITDSVPVEGSLSVTPGSGMPWATIWVQSRTWHGAGMMGPDTYGVRVWAADYSGEPFVEVDAGAEVILSFRPLYPVVELAWWADPTFGGSGVYSWLRVTDTSDSSTLYFHDNILPEWTGGDDAGLGVDPAHIYSLHLYSRMSIAHDSPVFAELVTLRSIPAPGALLLGVMGTSLAACLRRRIR